VRLCQYLNVCPGAQAAAISFLSLSNSGLGGDAFALGVQLQKFPALAILDLSGNSALDNGAVAVIVKVLTGKEAHIVHATIPMPLLLSLSDC
jgi:hypothetical protein